ncbi:MAG TPA: hypothetical protein DF699_13000 [Phycisphaerales bacterium]|nr:hypothetical protein [Phycisphaerae bacterium]HCT46120.1 hypothetical protein [Phycisphaerales bacterium]
MNPFPASKHYSHLDPSEPIPEIPLRYDEYKLRLSRAYLRAAPAMFYTALAIYIAFMILNPPLWVRVVGFVLFLVGAVFASWRLNIWGIRREMRHQQRAWATNDAWGIPIGLMIKGQAYYLATMVLVMQFVSVGAGVAGTLIYFAMYAICAGIYMMVAGHGFRQPGQICCERCNYPLVGLTLPTSCPECGRALLNLSFATDRPKLRDKRFLLLGIGLFVAGVLAFYVQFVKPTWAYAPLPRSVLLKLAPNDIDSFKALTARTLTPEDQDRLESSLIDAIVNDNTVGFWSHEQGAWLSSRVFSNQLSPDQIDRLMGVLGEPYIDAPDAVKAGERVSLMLRAPDVRMQTSDLYPYYYFGGYLIDQDPTPHMRSDHGRSWYALRDGTVTTDPEGRESPLFRFAPDSPGKVKVRVRLVIALFPGFIQMSQSGFAWGEEGDHSFVTQPVWSRVIDLEHTIEVEE